MIIMYKNNTHTHTHARARAHITPEPGKAVVPKIREMYKPTCFSLNFSLLYIYINDY